MQITAREEAKRGRGGLYLFVVDIAHSGVVGFDQTP
jgi:hypothetical protein